MNSRLPPGAVVRGRGDHEIARRSGIALMKKIPEEIWMHGCARGFRLRSDAFGFSVEGFEVCRAHATDALVAKVGNVYRYAGEHSSKSIEELRLEIGKRASVHPTIHAQAIGVLRAGNTRPGNDDDIAGAPGVALKNAGCDGPPDRDVVGRRGPDLAGHAWRPGSGPY